MIFKWATNFSSSENERTGMWLVVTSDGNRLDFHNRSSVQSKWAIIDYNRLTVLTVFYCQSVTIEALLCASVSTNRPGGSVWICFQHRQMTTWSHVFQNPYFTFSQTVSYTWTWINHLSTSTSAWSYIVACMYANVSHVILLLKLNKTLHLVLNKKEILLLEDFFDYNRFQKFYPIIDQLHVNERFSIIIDHRNNTSSYCININSANYMITMCLLRYSVDFRFEVIFCVRKVCLCKGCRWVLPLWNHMLRYRLKLREDS